MTLETVIIDLQMKLTFFTSLFFTHSINISSMRERQRERGTEGQYN